MSKPHDSTDGLAVGMMEVIPDLLCICAHGRIERINSAGLRMLVAGSQADLVGRPFFDFIHPDFDSVAELGLEALADEPEGMPVILKGLDGRPVDVEMTVRRLPGEGRTAVHARDITERMRAAETILRSEDRHRRLVELALDLTCVCSGGIVTFMNAAGLRSLGAPGVEAVIGRPFAELVHPDYRAIVDDGMEELARETGPLPMKMVRLDGEVLDVEVAVMRLGQPGENLFMVEARDVTGLKRSAEAIREREQRLQGIMDTVAEGIITADERGTIQSCNPAVQRIFGYDAGEMVGRPLAMLMPPDLSDRHQDFVDTYIATGQAKVLGIGRETQGRRKDGTVFPIEINVAQLKRGRSRLFIGTVRDITERKRAEEALRRARDELELRVQERTRELERLSRQTRLILDSANEGIIGVDGALNIHFANPAAAAMTGWSVEELIGRPLSALVEESAAAQWQRLPDGLLRQNAEIPLCRRDGGRFPAEIASAPMEEDGRLVGLVLVFRDVTERKRAEEKLRQAAKVFETTSEGILVTDSEHRVVAVNPAYCAITGYQPDELLGRPPAFLTSGLVEEEVSREIWRTVDSTSRWQGELWSIRKDGERYAERLSISAIADANGETRQYVVVCSDITQRKLDEERIRYQANYDSLTGLPNRALFMDRLQQAVATARRAGQRVGLMFIDLDGFKLVNDTLGHDVGDELLKEAGRRLQACVRSADTVARLGGDEFTIIMPDLRDVRNAPIVAQRIIESLERPFQLGGHEAFVSASIGITSFPDDATDTHDLLKNADAAMYRAKEQGKANYQFFTQELNAEATERLHIKKGLAKALEKEEFTLYYQPKVSLQTGDITGVEALLRWRNPDLGMVSPAKFIPVMEESGLIGAVGEWALEVACRQHREWRETGHPDVRVAVNLSVRQLRQPGLTKTVETLLARTGIEPAGIELEITESMIMKDTENAVAILRELHEMGIHLAMDDFGTGYSSLSYLKRFPLHTIKIDRSFIRDIATDPDDLQIIRTIISMGHSLRRRIVAEGVETEEQREILRKLRCDEIQGYLVSPPVPAAELSRMLAERRLPA